MQSFGIGIGGGDPDTEKELKQKRFAQELQEQIKARDEARVKEQIKRRGKLPGYIFDENEELPEPAYKKKEAQN